MKQKILDNVSEYSAEQLAEYIRMGIITFEELVQDTDGEFSVGKRKKVKHLLECGDADEWNNVKAQRSIEAVQHYLDTFPNGRFRVEARALKNELQRELEEKHLQKAADDAWISVNKSDINKLQEFIKEYPNSTHASEALKRINSLLLDDIMGDNVDSLVTEIKQVPTIRTAVTQEQRDNKTIEIIEEFLNKKKDRKSDFLNKIKEDPNLINSGVAIRLIKSGTLSVEDLTSIGIDRLFIRKMFKGESTQSFPTPQKLDRIHKQSTEIYFWGIPSSGKSCALGAILSVAASGKIAYSMDPDTGSQGYGYMTKLINLFKSGEIGTLMEGTSVDSFYEMGFDLIDKKGRRHPITCIDMAGELMRCMYKYNSGDPMSETDMIMLDTLTNVLRVNKTPNRKMHIFVIEYGAEERLYEGLPQRVYLEGAVSYIKNTGIFKKDTDAIYLMITKVDKVKNATKDTITEYIENNNYQGFYNGLEQICRDNEINKGKVEKIAFSLGEVCFQNYCRFNPRPAENVVSLLLQRSASFRGGIRGKLEKLFRS